MSSRSYYQHRSVLVTGGAGFIGSHLCAAVIERGAHVLCVDNFFTGSKSNIAHLLGNPRFELLRHDVVLPLFVEVDTIFNLACPASPVHYQRSPIRTIQCSTVGMVNVLDLAERTRARVLQASTSEVYGDPEVHPQREEYQGNVNPIGPRSCYDEGKRVAETLCMDYRREYGVDVRIARIFNTYGPRMAIDDGRVVSNFVVAALRGEDLSIYGDGAQTRSFAYVDDLVGGLLRLMETEAVEGPVNLGNPEEVSVRELARLVLELTGSRSRIREERLPGDDPRRRRPDISKATRILDWSPRIGLRDGLTRTVEYFREALRTSNEHGTASDRA
jgi:UDP-glucuronate decarboxylase